MRNIVLTILFLFIISGISWKDKTYGVTSVSVITSNGISGTVQNATTSAAITISVGSGAITNTQLAGSLTGLGYITGSGGTVTQATSKSTGVTLNKLCGDLTLNNAALAAATIVSFTLTNSTIAANDVIYVQHQSVGTFGAYTLSGRTAAGSAVISIRNNTAGSLGEAIVIKFVVLKAVII